jgi:hypothetical protein
VSGDASDDFTEVIRRAQKIGPGDVVDPFKLPERNAMIPGQASKIPGVESYDYESRAEVFCLPGDKGDYQDVMDRVLAGEALLRYEDRTFDKEGNFHVAIVYLIPKHRKTSQQTRNDEDAAGETEPVVKSIKLP